MARRARFAVAAVVVLVLTTGVAARPAENGGGRIVFASALPAYPVPANLNKTQAASVRDDGSGRVSLERPGSISPDGSRIAFIRAKPYTVWMVNADGTNPKLLLSPSAHDEPSGELRWSPDGRRLSVGIISRERCQSGTPIKCADWYLALADVDGTRRLVLSGRNLEWSPDGTQIAYEQGLFALDPESAQVVVSRSDGSRARTLRAPAGGPWCVGYWSRDGRWLLLWSDECQGRLAVVRPDASRLLATGGARPSMSLDGRRIVLAGRKTLRIADSEGKTIRVVRGRFEEWLQGDRRLLTSAGKLFRVLDREGRVVHSFQASSVSVSQTGSRIASLLGSTVTLRDSAGRRLRAIARVRGIRSLDDWAPDGKRLLTLAPATVGVLEVDAGRVTRVAAEPPGSRVVAWWSGNGRVYYESTLHVDSQRCRALWTMTPSGDDLRRVTRSPAYYGTPKWSLDGTRILATRQPCGNEYRDEPAAPKIVSLRVDGTEERVLVADGLDPVWSPDGTRIAFWRSGSNYGDGTTFVANADGSGIRRLVQAAHPDWSPDGTTIAANTLRGIVLIAPDGTNRRQLPSDVIGSSAPTWTPGGRLAYSRRVDGKCELFTTSGDPADATRIGAVCVGGSPTFSPDGSRLASSEPGLQDAYGESVDSVYVTSVADGARTNVTPWPVVSTQPDWSR